MATNARITEQQLLATLSDGYVFLDDMDGEFVNLYPVRSRRPSTTEGDDVLAALGYVKVIDWQPTRVAYQLVSVVTNDQGSRQ